MVENRGWGRGGWSQHGGWLTSTATADWTSGDEETYRCFFLSFCGCIPFLPLSLGQGAPALGDLLRDALRTVVGGLGVGGGDRGGLFVLGLGADAHRAWSTIVMLGWGTQRPGNEGGGGGTGGVVVGDRWREQGPVRVSFLLCTPSGHLPDSAGSGTSRSTVG